ncbi:hypothetical protein [Streptomyces sp. NPDC005017]|uniref:hypothetical protein n=1 Tax=Streptomyces sp. NPDC005017 TaxID=3364706 RepID=UPI00369F3A68
MSTTSDAELVAGLSSRGSAAFEALQVLRARHLPTLLEYARLCVPEERFAAQLCHQTLSTGVRVAAAGRVRPRAVRHSLLLLMRRHAAEWADDDRRQRLAPEFVHWLLEVGEHEVRHESVPNQLTHAFWRLPQHEQEILWYTEIEPGGRELAAICAGVDAAELAYHRDHALTTLLRDYLDTYGTSCDGPECRGYLRILDARARSSPPAALSTEFDTHLAACVRCEHALFELRTLYTAPRVALVPALVGYSCLAYAERATPVPRPAVVREAAHRHSAPSRPATTLHMALAVLVAAVVVGVVLGVRASV